MATRRRVPKGSTTEQSPLQEPVSSTPNDNMNSFLRNQPVWIGLAITSGACAAINGVFAKLTTTSLTSSFSSHISTLLGLAPDNAIINLLLRGTFFGLNLLFNAIMWGLFTTALRKGTSATRVSIVNVSANFFLTAIMGWIIFAERLPPLWWLGAGLLACGNVIIGAREEKEQTAEATGTDETYQDNPESSGLLSREHDVEADIVLMDESLDENHKISVDENKRIREAQNIDAPI